MSPLNLALINLHFDTAAALIEAGADVNATHDHGYTVFMSAVGSDRNPELLRLLQKPGNRLIGIGAADRLEPNR